MRLTSLTISGFKSFARTTTFEFPVPVSAIVGPNGSGKSNVAESIRWVLGEQSLKTLRGKKGEDLIFNGSPTVPRIGKASVALSFDNRDHAIPLDFDTVTLERKIFRDGINEYRLNGSTVRLKDIVELLARMGLGETKHNIIGQGEVDRLLLASPRDRRELLEEAIGLRIWQLKKREAERKLAETATNVEQVGALLREIRPHLKFLRTQAEKAERRESVRRELEEHCRAFVQRERAAIRADERALEERVGPARETLKRLEKEIEAASKHIAGGERAGASHLKAQEAAVAELDAKRQDLERELGRAEGRLEVLGKERPHEPRPIPFAAVNQAMDGILDRLRRASELSDIAAVRSELGALMRELEERVAGWRGAEKQPNADRERLAAERDRLHGELAEIGKKLSAMRKELAAGLESVRDAESALRKRFEELRTREEEANTLRVSLERFRFEEEKLAMRREELERLISESGFSRAALETGEIVAESLGLEELRKKIDKLRARLEEIGGIDAAVLAEFQETEKRSTFLERELADLEAAEDDLRELIAELESRIERDFREGFAKIREAFAEYFKIIFGGGKGDIAYVPFRVVPAAAESDAADANDEEKAEPEYGVEIKVDLPRKRIKGLAMLSGGERALVSIALLFAITAVNPPPFLILDETDAALDEANSRRYAAILKELSKKTQLIVITHNRETMQQAGVLYGVTMGDDGVSRILSLKLEEAKIYGNR
ncbi:hypothetical protein C4552_00885 [Candidatus Parcubacteria bacterium]|nr:MAG: hypothetical protein C4552_00885 [Candidatus Parcubacteria bacterium]